jgi:hypothetical protein
LLLGFVIGFAAFAQTDTGQEGEVPPPDESVVSVEAEGEEPSVPGASAEAVSAETADAEAAAAAAADGETALAAETTAAEMAAAETELSVPPEAPVALEAGPSGIETIPEELRRPRRGEAPRYPRDLVIGTLGRGSAPEEAYALARHCLEAILVKNPGSEYLAAADTARREAIFAGLETLAPVKFRIGGGREEPDGSASFLFRFIGREEGIAGELYLRQEEEQEQWFFDDMILEDVRRLADMADGKEAYRYDFSPYERFF